MKRPRGKIAGMLLRQSRRHVSFHTPGHKIPGADITELSYSDNLFSPSGVLKEAEEDIARILGAERSFILTDGSSCGIHAMLYALKLRGANTVAASAFSHHSVWAGCRFLGLNVLPVPPSRADGIPLQPTEEELEATLEGADALLLTSPDYYGNFPPLSFARELCDRTKKPLVIDGAHGAHLHFSPEYAGNFADLWTDGVHKSLPALTQGAVVSANGDWAETLSASVKAFRTTSPSYPVMASVEEAVKFPRNEKIERAAEDAKRETGALGNADWSKIVIPFGEESVRAQAALEGRGIYPEFNDGNYLMFYLSPATGRRDLKKLCRIVKRLRRGEPRCETPLTAFAEGETEELPLSSAAGRVCARECGIFPPCLPLFCRGEIFTEEGLRRLSEAEHTYGLAEGRVLAFGRKEKR